MASRRGKKPRRRAARKGAYASPNSSQLDPQLEKFARSFAQLTDALGGRPQPSKVQDALDDCQLLLAAMLGVTDVETESNGENPEPSKLPGHRKERRRKSLDVESATLTDLTTKQKEQSSQLVKRFGRSDISQVPTGFLTADEPEGLFMVAAPKPWILNVDSYARCVHLLTKIGDMVSMDLAFRVSLLALTHPPEQHSTGNGKQVDEWLSYTYASLAALEGKAHRQDRKIIELTDMQLALVGQLKGLALRREHERVAKSKGIPTADAMDLIERDLAELYAKLPPMMVQKAKALEPQATPERVVEHLRKFYGEEVPHRLTPSAVEHMASRVSLNHGSKGKQSAERVVLDWFGERGYK